MIYFFMRTWGFFEVQYKLQEATASNKNKAEYMNKNDRVAMEIFKQSIFVMVPKWRVSMWLSTEINPYRWPSQRFQFNLVRTGDEIAESRTWILT